MVNRYLIVVCAGMMMLIAFVGLVPQTASAAIKDVDAYAQVQGRTITIFVKWTYSEYDQIKLKLFHNSIEVKNEGTYSGYANEKETTWIQHNPIKAGTYKLQLWSESDDKELFSKDWVLPGIQITLAVSPTTGQMGTTFVATTTFSASSTAPEDYYFSGTLEIHAGDAVFKQNVGGDLVAAKYYQYWDVKDYTLTQIFFATGFTFPAKGTYSISAKYTDTMTDTSATVVTITMTNQFENQITSLSNEVNTTKKTASDAADKAESTKNDLSDQLTQSRTFGLVGMVVGILGIVLALVAMMAARKAKSTVVPYQPPAPAVSAPPAPPAYIPPPAPPAAPAMVQPQAPATAQASSTFCGRCGRPFPPNVQFCPSCGMSR